VLEVGGVGKFAAERWELLITSSFPNGWEAINEATLLIDALVLSRFVL